jgi:hypothetical protein
MAPLLSTESRCNIRSESIYGRHHLQVVIKDAQLITIVYQVRYFEFEVLTAQRALLTSAIMLVSDIPLFAGGGSPSEALEYGAASLSSHTFNAITVVNTIYTNCNLEDYLI